MHSACLCRRSATQYAGKGKARARLGVHRCFSATRLCSTQVGRWHAAASWHSKMAEMRKCVNEVRHGVLSTMQSSSVMHSAAVDSECGPERDAADQLTAVLRNLHSGHAMSTILSVRWCRLLWHLAALVARWPTRGPYACCHDAMDVPCNEACLLGILRCKTRTLRMRLELSCVPCLLV
jgi:hypothetical protein